MNQAQLLEESLGVVAIARIDAGTGRFVAASPAFERLTGYSEQELRGLTLPDAGAERRWTARDGREIWLSVTPLAAGGALVQDITPAKQAQAARGRTQQFLNAVLEASTQAVISVNRQGQITMANLGAERIYGYTRQELAGESIELLVPERLRTMHVAHRRRFAENPTDRPAARGVEIIGRRKDGSEFPAEISLSHIAEGPDGEPATTAFVTDITARKAAQAALANARDQFEATLNASTQVAIIATGPHGVITLFNSGAENLLGYRAADVIGKLTPLAFHRDEEIAARGRELAAEFGCRVEGFGIFVESAKRGGYDDREWTYVRRDGSHRRVNLAVTAVRNSAGEITGFLGVATDVTARKNLERQLERALRETGQTLRTLIDAAPLAILSTDGKGRIVTFNPAAERIFGYSAAQAVGRPNPLPVDGSSGTQERTVRRKDGTLVEVSVSSAPLADDEGHAAGVIYLVEDITERKKAEVQLRQSQDRYRRLVEIMPDAMFVNVFGRVAYANPAAVKLFGAGSSDDLIGKTPFDLYHPAHHAKMRERIERVLAAHSVPAAELRIVRLDGRVVAVEAAATSFEDGGHTAIQVVLHDLSERRKAEAELRRMARLLMTAQEDEARRIARELHDDLSQSLALVSIDMGKLAAQRGTRLETREQLRDFQRRVGQVSDAMRFLSHSMHPAILDDLGLEAAAEDFCASFGKREDIAVDFHCRLASPPGREVAGCLYRVLQEALRNVSKHAKATRVSVAITDDEGRIRLVIEDNGTGFLTDGPAAQAGLGLISMKERVNALGGDFGVRSSAGNGTRIEVSAPSHPA